MKGLYLTIAMALAMLAVVLPATPAVAGHVLDFQVLGRGTVDNDCAVGVPGACNFELSGQASGDQIGHDDFALTLRKTLTSTILANGAGGSCVVVTGDGTITPPSAATEITFNLVGIVCEEGAAGTPAHFDGTYRITGGTGRFADAVGGGSLTATFTRGTGVGDVFMHLHGTIR